MMDDRAFDSTSYVREIFIYSELYSCICRPCNINFYFQRRISRKQFQFRRVRFLFRGRSAVETAARLTSMNQSILQNRGGPRPSHGSFVFSVGDGRTNEIYNSKRGFLKPSYPSSDAWLMRRISGRMPGDICSRMGGKGWIERGRERTRRYRSTGYRREMAFTRDKDSLMDDSARCLGRSSDTPGWYFDGLIDVDTMTSLPEVRVRSRTDLCDTETTDNGTPWWMIPLFTAGKHLEEHRSRIDFRIWVNLGLAWSRME